MDLKSGKKLAFVILVIAAAVTAAGLLYFKPFNKDKSKDAVKDTFGYQVLKIDGEYVDQSIFTEERDKLFYEWKNVSDMLRKTDEERNDIILDNVMKRIVLEDFLYNKAGVTVTDEEIEDHINRYVRSKFSTDEEMQEMMENSSVKNEEGLKKSIKEFLLNLKALPKVAREYGITVEDKEIEEEYKYFRLSNTKVDLKRIFISAEKRSEEEAAQTAQKVYKELLDGASFELLVKEYSDDDKTKDSGGLFESYPIVELEGEAIDIMLGAEEGKLLTPIKTEHGYDVVMIVKLQKFYPEKDLFAENLYISKFTGSDKYKEWLENLKSQFAIEITDPGMRAFKSNKDGKYLEAAQDYERAYKKNKTGEYLEKAAENYKLAGKWEEVKRVSDSGIKEYPLGVPYYVYMAEYQYKSNKKDEALDILKKAEELASQTKNVIHLEQLEKAYLDIGLKEDAERVRKIATSLD